MGASGHIVAASQGRPLARPAVIEPRLTHSAVYRPQGALIRLLAAFIDILVLGALLTLLAALLPSASPLAASLLVFLAFYAYFGVLEGIWGRTVGKRVCGLRVIMLDERPCTMSAGLLRNLTKLPALATGIGMLLTLLFITWSPKDQRLGDRLAGTVVVREMPVGTPLYE